MDLQSTYTTLINWLNSCVTAEQIDLTVEAADRFLVDRFGADKEYADFRIAAEDKKNLPSLIFNT